jgi:hypothetical protein
MMGGSINFPSIAALVKHKFGKPAGVDDAITYIHYSYSTDIHNPYKYLFPAERRDTVYKDNKLFKWARGKDSEWLESIGVIEDAISTYKHVMLTPAERMLLAMNIRMEKFEKQMSELEVGKPKDEKDRFDAILSMQKLIKEYEKEALVEKEQEEWKENMRLFEIPDDQWEG